VAEAPATAGPLLWAARAWLPGGWHQDVLLQAGADGCWSRVQAGVPAPADAQVLAGPALPGLVDAHSHAFQRAFAGLAERRARDQDDFWGWRERMYGVALRVTPDQQHAIAAQLYSELLRGGYTQVCEFHYLHHAPDGKPYPGDPVHLLRALAAGAAEVGIGLTLLPTVYERAGFAQPALREDQRRFRASADAVLAMQAALAGVLPAPLLRVGAALHSLRAATPESLQRLADQMPTAPLHIHVAEQTLEVQDCLAATGLRPIEWLCRHAALDARWHLVHATHATPDEIDSVAGTGAGVVLCPSTEANLGDGVADLPGWLAAGVPLSLGSDSHVTRSMPEELRLLEYSQRFVRRERCVAADPARDEGSTAARLWRRVLAGGAAAAGYGSWGLQAGARADLLVVDTQSPALLGIAPDQVLDALVFSSPGRPFRDVMVAGAWRSQNHHLLPTTAGLDSAAIAARFAGAMETLWSP